MGAPLGAPLPHQTCLNALFTGPCWGGDPGSRQQWPAPWQPTQAGAGCSAASCGGRAAKLRGHIAASAAPGAAIL